MDELLPCPFCGGTDVIDDWDDYGDVMQRCDECDAQGSIVLWNSTKFLDYASKRTEARRLWNQRATMHVRFTKSEVAHDMKWPFVLLGRPVIESDDLVTPPIIVGGHLLEPGETIAEVLDRIDGKPTP